MKRQEVNFEMFILTNNGFHRFLIFSSSCDNSDIFPELLPILCKSTPIYPQDSPEHVCGYFVARQYTPHYSNTKILRLFSYFN